MKSSLIALVLVAFAAPALASGGNAPRVDPAEIAGGFVGNFRLLDSTDSARCARNFGDALAVRIIDERLTIRNAGLPEDSQYVAQFRIQERAKKYYRKTISSDFLGITYIEGKESEGSIANGFEHVIDAKQKFSGFFDFFVWPENHDESERITALDADSFELVAKRSWNQFYGSETDPPTKKIVCQYERVMP